MVGVSGPETGVEGSVKQRDEFLLLGRKQVLGYNLSRLIKKDKTVQIISDDFLNYRKYY